MQEEVTRKTIALAIKTAKLDAVVLQKAIRLVLKQIDKQRKKPKRGKQSLRQLKKTGEKVTNIPITDENIKAFDAVAKTYELDYHVKKQGGDNGEIPRYLVFFKGKDVDNVMEAFREFSAMKLTREPKKSVRQELSQAKQEAKSINAALDKVKNMDRGREL